MAQFVQVAGSQLMLPDAARMDLAFVQSKIIGNVSAGTNVAYTASGAYFEVPLAFYAHFVTSSTVSTRQVLLLMTDNLAVNLWFSAAPITQTATTDVSYSATSSVTTATSGSSSLVMLALPPWVMQAGSTFGTFVSGLASGDQFQAVAITTLKIPSGPPRALPSPSVATPVLL